MYKRTCKAAHARILIACIAGFIAAGAAYGDTISPLNTFPGSSLSWNFTNWYYGCQFEFGCGSDSTFGLVASNFLTNYVTLQNPGVLYATLSGNGASFAYSEVDDLSGNAVDYVAFNNGTGTGPVTFTFKSYETGQPITAAGFSTNLYEANPFTATASAYDAQGNLLGSISVPSVANNNETYLFTFGPPTYSAFVGLQDLVSSLPVVNIASVVVSTTDNWFGFGGTGVELAPAELPMVTAVTPNSGPLAGGNGITITGSGFTGETAVGIGGADATNVVVVSDTTITAIAPPGRAGPASVVVVTPNGVSPTNSLYTYGSVASAPPPLQILSLGSVNLQVIPNESLVASSGVSIVANQSGAWQATSSTSWLTLTRATGSFPGALTATANATGLGTGTYQGSITVTSAGSVTPATLAVPVTLTVLAPAALTVSSSVLPSAFGYSLGSATGYDVQVGPAGLAFTAQTSPDSASWLSINPVSGVAPATIHVVVDPSKATNGTYQDSLVMTSPGAPNSPLSIPVKMAVSSFVPSLPQQVNGATGAGPDHTVAPNEIVSLFLSDFSCSAQPVVSINGTAVAWSIYSSGQLNYAVPANVMQASLLSVACNGATAWSFNGLEVAAVIPGIFTTAGTGTGQAAATNTDGTINGAANAASRGSVVSVFVTGFGAFGTAVSPGGQPLLAGAVAAQIGGLAATVQYAGGTPGSTNGLQRIDLLIPAGSPVGAAVPVLLQVDGTPAQTTATIAVK